jgi:TonB family protein
MKVTFRVAMIVCFLTCLVFAASGIAQTPPSSQTPDLVESQELTARVFKLYGERKYDEALPFAKRALELREAALGRNHEDLIPLLLNLGELYIATQKLSDAHSSFERALQISEKTFGADDLRVARILDRLGYVAYAQRDERKAESLFARSLAIREKAADPESPDLAKTAFALGELYRFRSDFAKAGPLYQRVIRIREKFAQKDDPELLKALQGYLIVLFGQNRTDEVGPVQKRIAELVGDTGPIQGGVLNGKAISLPVPEYPVAARSDHASGQVRVQVLIDETGRVIQARVVNAGGIHFALIDAAEKAARRARFTPTLLSGMPVKVNGVIIYNFFAQ